MVDKMGAGVEVGGAGRGLRPVGWRGAGPARERGAVPKRCSYLVLVEAVTPLPDEGEEDESLRQS